jgi:hypothetical protein
MAGCGMIGEVSLPLNFLLMLLLLECFTAIWNNLNEFMKKLSALHSANVTTYTGMLNYYFE